MTKKSAQKAFIEAVVKVIKKRSEADESLKKSVDLNEMLTPTKKNNA